MDGSYVTLIAISFSVLLILSQRIEPRHRGKLRFVIFLTVVGLWLARYNLRVEHSTGVAIALVVNFLFWLFIGRYNPVQSSEDTIKVYGMDD